MAKKPSRILNDDTLVFGLDRNDLMGLAFMFYVFQIAFRSLQKDYVALFATLIATVILINIRLKFRKKIIRDFVKFLLAKILKRGVYNDPKDN